MPERDTLRPEYHRFRIYLMTREDLFRFCKVLGFFTVSRWITRNRLRILGYHGIWFTGDHFGNHLFMSPEKFKSRMEWLKASKYTVIPLDDAIENLRNNNLPSCPTVITIDDGWYGTYRYMLPILEKHELAATLYVFTAAVDAQEPLPLVLLPALVDLTNEEYFRMTDPGLPIALDCDLRTKTSKRNSKNDILSAYWGISEERREEFARSLAAELGFDYDEIMRSRQFSFITYEEIADSNRRGMDIQLHTHSHRIQGLSIEALERDILLNRDKLEPHVKSSLAHFCYPGGIHRPDLHECLENMGLKSATLTDTGLVTRKTNRFSLQRIMDGQEISQLELEAELSGFLELIRGIRRSISRWR
jgi:peptidoglycan/xylan/chitin deacetylase (PgdA/CDA1 family)